jgi:adenylate cyclase
LPETEFSTALERLKAGDFVYEQSLYPVVELVFKHPLTQEVAYNSQLQGQRAETHAAVARAIAAHEAENLDEQAALLAYHWEAANQPVEAVKWHERAAIWAGAKDIAASFRHWQRVLDLLPELPSTKDSFALGARANASMLSIGWFQGIQKDTVKQTFEAGSALAEQAGDTELLAQLTSAYGFMTGHCAGYIEEQMTYGLESVRLADLTDNVMLQDALRTWVVFSHMFAGRLEQAVRAAEALLEKLPDDALYGAELIGTSPLILTTHVLGMSAAHRGDFTVAERAGAEAERVSIAHDWPEMLCLTHISNCYTAWLAGDDVSLQARALEAFRIAEDQGYGFVRVFANFWVGVAHRANGDLDQAAKFLNIARNLDKDTQIAGFMAGTAMGALAETLLAQGKRDEARVHAVEAVEFCRTRGIKWEIQPWLALARVLIAAGEQRAALEVMEEAQQILTETGARACQPMLHECRAEFARAFDAEWTSEEELQVAYELFSDIGASGHAERVAKVLGLTPLAEAKSGVLR